MYEDAFRFKEVKYDKDKEEYALTEKTSSSLTLESMC